MATYPSLRTDSLAALLEKFDFKSFDLAPTMQQQQYKRPRRRLASQISEILEERSGCYNSRVRIPALAMKLERMIYRVWMHEMHSWNQEQIRMKLRCVILNIMKGKRYASLQPNNYTM